MKITEARLKDKWWRLNNLYWMLDDDGNPFKFSCNVVQAYLFANIWWKNVILKARQLGFTTFIDLYILDECLFHGNLEAAIIAHRKDDAEKIFQRKIAYPYKHLPEWLKEQRKLENDSQEKYRISNNSVVSVTTSARSGTLQLLHLCLSGSTDILTKHSFVKKIKDIKPGDLVMTGSGSYQKVQKVVENKIKDVGYPLLSIKTFGNYKPLKITANHEVLTREYKTGYPVWKQAGDIQKNDYIAFPTREPSMKLRTGDLPLESGDRITPGKDFGYLVGLYLAEGHLRGNEIAFAGDRDEDVSRMKLFEKFRHLTSSIRIYHHKDSQTSNITLVSKDLGRLFESKFVLDGDKYIPDCVWGWGRQFLDGLLKGYFDGDGCYKNVNSVVATSIRRQLLDQIKLILISLRFGYPAIYNRKAGHHYGRNCQEVWTLMMHGAGNWKFREYFGLELPEITSWKGNWRLDHGRRPEGRKFWRRGKDYYWSRVKNVEHIEDEPFVYDLVLEKDPHNYVTTNGIVHNSEYGALCAKFPDKAREVKTGSIPAASGKNALIFIESTAEGQGGDYYTKVQNARKLHDANKPLTRMDYRYFFFPWYEHPNYLLSSDESEHVVVDNSFKNYFRDLEHTLDIEIPKERRAWYVKAHEEFGDDMKREYPSTADEAFEQAIHGTYFASEFRKIREQKRICKIPIEPGLSVHTWWDLGYNDTMSLWFSQLHGREVRLINYYENSHEGLAHYKKYLLEFQKEHDIIYGQHLAPHDIKVHELTTGESRLERARAMGVKFVPIPRCEDKMDSIEAARNMLSICWFDEERCSLGIQRLEKYRKEWNERLQAYASKPLHDENSNGADAFQTGAWGKKYLFDGGFKSKKKSKRRVSARGWT